MKAAYWVPPAVFLAVSIPLVLLLNALDVGGDYRVWIALAAGVLATALVQSQLAKKAAGFGKDAREDTQA